MAGILALVSKAAQAATAARTAAATAPRRRSYNVDPMWAVNALRYREKPTGLSYDILRAMAKRDPIVAAIMRVRATQIAELAIPVSWTRNGAGYCVRLRDHERSPTPVERRRIEELERFFFMCGSQPRAGRDRFKTFIKKFVRDSMTLDQAVIEKVRGKYRDDVMEFVAVDGASMRIQGNPSSDEVTGYAQIVQGMTAREFPPENIVWSVRTPRTDLQIGGYGYPELEDLINVVASHLYADDYNQRAFTQGAMPKGLFLLKGVEPTDEMIEAFQRQWEMRLYGIAGAHMVPWISVPGGEAEWVNMQPTAKDMEFSAFQTYLVNAISAIFLIDPAEVNHPNRGDSQATPLFGGSSIEARLTTSRDRGLRPLISHVSSELTEHILWEQPNGEDFVFDFEGVDREDKRARAEIEEIEVRTRRTINEIRADHDEAPIEGGDIICNPDFMMARAQAMQGVYEVRGASAGALPPPGEGEVTGPAGDREALPAGVGAVDASGGEPLTRSRRVVEIEIIPSGARRVGQRA